MTTDKRVPLDQGSSLDETSLKQGVEKIPTLIPTGEQIVTTIPSTTAIVTPLEVTPHSFPITTTETVTPMRIPG